jgi:hypothetical protein
MSLFSLPSPLSSLVTTLLKPAAGLMSVCMAAALLPTPLRAATPAATGAAATLTPEQQEVFAPFQALLDGVAKRDHELVRKQLFPGGMATLIRDGQPLQLHFDAFVERLPTTGTVKLEELIHDPVVHIDDNIAVIWAPYTFTFDGKMHHCGTNIITLIRRDGRWLISGIADNSRTDCPAK